ncbi:hypothetical protein CVT26_008307 [Gymnopilus dilepis]|uniref:Uncharacterized protein n=1 Tax=Gymnopilus dilepis TaxID=231916 RepID=A0A409W9P0_9AGAR|nr:hypothetical protein CVT26_008307 [Gymnopilus dilepis]
MSVDDKKLYATDSLQKDGRPITPSFNPVRDGEAPPASKGRFDIEILSVYYYADGDGVCAAVVLKTSFILKDGRQLKYAECPIEVHAEDDSKEQLSIIKYHPLDEEFVQVDYNSGKREWTLNPAILLPHGGAQVGSMSASRTDHQVKMISLQAANRQDRTPRITWYYKDSKKTFYPGGVEVLLIVRKTTNASWFRFKLQLSTELKVDVHGAIPFVTDFRDRLVGVPKRGTNGWNFEIKGRYNEEHAIKVLNSLESDPSVGLKSAAREMIVALNPPPYQTARG